MTFSSKELKYVKRPSNNKNKSQYLCVCMLLNVKINFF